MLLHCCVMTIFDLREMSTITSSMKIRCPISLLSAVCVCVSTISHSKSMTKNCVHALIISPSLSNLEWEWTLSRVACIFFRKFSRIAISRGAISRTIHPKMVILAAAKSGSNPAANIASDLKFTPLTPFMDIFDPPFPFPTVRDFSIYTKHSCRIVGLTSVCGTDFIKPQDLQSVR